MASVLIVWFTDYWKLILCSIVWLCQNVKELLPKRKTGNSVKRSPLIRSSFCLMQRYDTKKPNGSEFHSASCFVLFCVLFCPFSSTLVLFWSKMRPVLSLFSQRYSKISFTSRCGTAILWCTGFSPASSSHWKISFSYSFMVGVGWF